MKKTIIILLLMISLLAMSVIADGCIDMDGDGYGANNHPDCLYEGYDCNDFDPMINPGAEEICDDGIDNNCNGLIDCEDPSCYDHTNCEVDYVEGECWIKDIYWVNCDNEEINSANEGDGVFLIVETKDCSLQANVEFRIIEKNNEMEITSSNAQYFKQDSDEINWAAYWLAGYLEDPDNPDYIEYYIEVDINDPIDGIKRSSRKANTLKVHPCPVTEPECGIECELIPLEGYNPISTAGTSGFGAIIFPSTRLTDCVVAWDCSQAIWSDCNPVTGKMTRNTDLCRFIGLGGEECAELHRPELPTEKMCSSQVKVIELQPKEIEVPLVEKEKDEFPWIAIIIITILLALLIGGGLWGYKYYQKSKKVKPLEDPFNNENDKKAVVGYIESSKKKNIPEDLIKEALKKSGWNEKQINYALKKANSQTVQK